MLTESHQVTELRLAAHLGLSHGPVTLLTLIKVTVKMCLKAETSGGWALEKTLMLGKIEGRRRRGRQRMTWLDGITCSMDMNLSKSGSW